MRLDKFLCEMNIGSRSQVKDLIRRGQVTVNGQIAASPERKIDESADCVTFQGRELSYRSYVYYMMNKPAGVVSSTRDSRERTVLELLQPYLREEDRRKEIFPAGRLDKDTEGLLLLTNDGALAHELLSPAGHVDKTYLVSISRPLSPEDAAALEQGVDIGEKKLTAPAKVSLSPENPCEMTLKIHEGKFHQIKRMLQAIDNEVLSLKRVGFGGLRLDEALQPGQCRELTEEETAVLRRAAGQPEAGQAENGISQAGQTGNGLPQAGNTRDIPEPEPQAAPRMRPCPPRMAGVEAVIFDLDGTLVDSMWMWRAIDIEYLGRFGIPLPEDLQKRIEGMSFQETAVYFKEHFGIPDSLEQIKADWNAMAWDKYEHEVPLKPGVKEFLDECRKREIKLGIATSNSRELLENIANTHGLHDYFACIMTGSDVKKGKPAPDIYLAVAETLQAAPERCLVFEDIIPGIRAGKNAGMQVCAVEDVYSADAREKKQALADYYIGHYGEIHF